MSSNAQADDVVRNSVAVADDIGTLDVQEPTDEITSTGTPTEELESLQEAALAIPDSDSATQADAASVLSDAAISAPVAEYDAKQTTEKEEEITQGSPGVVLRPNNESQPLSNPGTVMQASQPMDWSKILGYSSQGLGAATTASSTGFAFARGATAFGLNLAKRITQGLVALPAMAVDGAMTGTVPGDGGPSLAKVAHMTVGGFFDAISLVALGGIDVTSALTGAGLGAAGSGVEGLRRWIGSEVLRSLSEFSKLVKREWNADDDALPPGGIPAYSIIGITQALTAWVCIQLVTREYQERRMLGSMAEVDLDALQQQLKAAQREEQEREAAAETASSDAAGVREPVRITSKEAMSGAEGNMIGAEIGSKAEEGSSAFEVPRSTSAQPLTNLDALRGLQRYSKLVLGVYGGLALAWLNSLPPPGITTASEAAPNGSSAVGSTTNSNTTIFSAEDEFLSRDQAEFLEAATQMDLPEESDAEGADDYRMPGAMAAASGSATDAAGSRLVSHSDASTQVSSPSVNGQTSVNPSGTAQSYLDIISGQHDNELFHRTANLEKGAAQEGSYDESIPRANPHGKAAPSKPRFYVVTDHPRKVIILVLRGSLSVGDFAADLTCESVPFTCSSDVLDGSESAVAAPSTHAAQLSSGGSADGEDLCHEGMLITAREIGDVGRPVHRAVTLALRKNDGYSLDIAGHSLGAGVASILAMMWGDPATGLTTAASGLPVGRRIHSYCYAVPCVTSESLAKKCESLVTSHVFSYDFVTRLSLGAIQDIRNGCAWLCYEDAEASKQARRGDQGPNSAAGPKKMSSLMRKAFEHQAGRLDSADGDEKEQVEADFLSLRKTLEANMHGTHLFPPGKVLYSLPSSDLIESDSAGRQLSAPRVDRDRLFTINSKADSLKNVFGQIIFSRTMLSGHMPSVYDKALHRLPH